MRISPYVTLRDAASSFANKVFGRRKPAMFSFCKNDVKKHSYYLTEGMRELLPLGNWGGP